MFVQIVFPGVEKELEKELERLQSLGVIKPVATSDWAAPIVPVVKRYHSIRVCGDYKLTINQASNIETYPLPRIEEIFGLFGSLSGGKTFTKLDLQNAYQQLLLEEKSQELVTLNTHRGLVPIYMATLRDSFCISNFPKNYGNSVTSFSRCMCILGRHSSYRST